MNRLRFRLALIACWTLVSAADSGVRRTRADYVPTPPAWAAQAEAAKRPSNTTRGVPRPLPDRPGNVFLVGDAAEIAVAAPAVRWVASDYDGHPVGQGHVADGLVRLSTAELGVGWYRLDLLDQQEARIGHTTLAVLEPLKAPVPDDSPVCLDSATCWFSRHHVCPYDPRGSRLRSMEVYANLAALAGANWIRDRMDWAGIEPEPGVFRAQTLYDESVDRQRRQGLNVLQVFHDTPAWAWQRDLDGDDGLTRVRFPRDLRHVHAFAHAMAQRFRGRIQAWQPRNEADHRPFGGHLIDEICAYQKAAYLGFKRADPNVLVCWSPYALPTALHRDGMLANETWAYFDVYTMHSYRPPETYLHEFATIRDGASGRPIWLTEAGKAVPYAAGTHPRDPTPTDMRRQAEFITRSYASSLFAGVDRHFYYILGDGGDSPSRTVDWGLLRSDFTPRPAYVALAAVGRFLAGARCLGRLGPTAYVFRGRPDGVASDVLVAWPDADGQNPAAELARGGRVYDFLGRSLDAPAVRTSGSRPVFAILPEGRADSLDLEAPPARSPLRTDPPSPIVLQAVLPRERARLPDQAYEIPATEPSQIPVNVYNFGDTTAYGRLHIEDPSPAVQASIQGADLELPPNDRQEILLRVVPDASAAGALAAGVAVTLRGEFGAAGRPVLALRLAADPRGLVPKLRVPIPLADDAERWRPQTSAGTTMRSSFANLGALAFDLEFAGDQPWAAPYIDLHQPERPASGVAALAYTVQLLEGAARVRVTFTERSEDAIHHYRPDVPLILDSHAPRRIVQRFAECPWVEFLSSTDPTKTRDSRVQPERLFRIYVNIGPQPGQPQVRLILSDFEWIGF